MQLISNQTFGGERALYKLSNAVLDHVTIEAGESPLKHGTNLRLKDCLIKGKYPLWINTDTEVDNCRIEVTGRSGFWYLRNFTVRNTVFECPKAFRDSDGIVIEKCSFPDAEETLWSCRNVEVNSSTFDKADYILAHSSDVRLKGITVNGNYLGQWGRNIEVFDSVLHSKDAFWNTENVTCYNCTLDGEYLGWHSRNLHLVNCTIKGQQPLCYCENLVLDGCTFDPDAVLAFEYCSVKADVKGAITSVKNPTTGSITADSIGEVILDGNCLPPANCRIRTR
ncbi:MAG: DUF3737 family protein [Sutterellaceae bacterium]|nr:DUF3737 family protein [Sutterellaceae bacterium]MDD7442767.1 DUF3737 family protein [Sutterellaceae bacterium]MDY2867614.1 DUF3737 family protein [Mesosutterella sp.]